MLYADQLQMLVIRVNVAILRFTVERTNGMSEKKWLLPTARFYRPLISDVIHHSNVLNSLLLRKQPLILLSAMSRLTYNVFDPHPPCSLYSERRVIIQPRSPYNQEVFQFQPPILRRHLLIHNDKTIYECKVLILSTVNALILILDVKISI